MATHGNRRAPVAAQVTFGVAELHPDPYRPYGWTLSVDGVPQSYVDSADPEFLPFEYVRRLATVVRSVAPEGVPLPVLHLGGGGLTLPRLVDRLRPGSAQRVVERDGELAALVERLLPAPASVRVTVGDALTELAAETESRYDLIVADVFDGARMPASVAGVGFATAAARALRPGGLLAMNLTDLPPLAHSRIQVATLRAAFADVCLIGGTAMLRGRRGGDPGVGGRPPPRGGAGGGPGAGAGPGAPAGRGGAGA